MSQAGLPIVAIVGRPNVGKSTLFNVIAGERRAIVGDEPGITRDRIYHPVNRDGRAFMLVDTGGLLPDERELIPREILKQAEIAIAEAERVLLVVDARAGLHPLDGDICRLLQRSGKQFLVVANKVDTVQSEPEILQFYRLGVDRVYPMSAEHCRGLAELLDDLLAGLTRASPAEVEPETKVAIIGRPNVGKSSLVNAMLGFERVIVSEIPGTTRDAVDTELRLGDLKFRLIDTAGIRRKGKTHLMAEKLSVVLARKHLDRADLAVLLLDPVEGVTHLDATIAGYALESGKAIILGINKLDLLPGGRAASRKLETEVHRKLRFLDYAPVVSFSAKTGRYIQELFPLLRKAHEHRQLRVNTGAVNQFYRRLLKRRQIEALPFDDLGIKYLTQIRVAPPTFLLFLKRNHKLHFSEQRFIVNQLRREFEFFANPIHLIQRS